MKVLVTGGGGFLGFAIVKQLLQNGYEVCTYSRNTYEALETLGVDQYQGDLRDYPALQAAMQGCEGVFHLAAKLGNWGSYASFYNTNVLGTESVLKACQALRIPRLVFSSSPSVVFNGSSTGDNESLPYSKKFDAFYPKTKAIAEQMVLRANNATLHTCALRPHLIWGPGDLHLLPALIQRHQKGRLLLPGKGQYLIDTIYVDNAARAHVQAFEAMGKNPDLVGGKPYFLSQGEPITIYSFFNQLLAAAGYAPTHQSIHPILARSIAWFLEGTFRMLNLKPEPPLTIFVAKNMSSTHWFDITAARRDLGYTPLVSSEEGMKHLQEWIETTHPYPQP